MMQQQKGINLTYRHLCEIGVVEFILDTKEGVIMSGDNREIKINTMKIFAYHDSEIIIEK